jgi:hypothetical protein
MITCKIQYHNYEEGEFDKYDNLSNEKHLELFEGINWFQELKKKTAEDITASFVIENQDHIIKIYPFDDTLFDLLYFPKQRTKFYELTTFYRKRSSMKEISEVIILFLNGKFSSVIESCYEMNTADGKSELRKTKDKNLIYHFSYYKDLFYTLIIYSIFILAIVFFNFFNNDLTLSIPSLILIMLFLIPLIVYYQYLRCNKHMEVYLTRGKDYFLVMQKNVPKKYLKTDILKVLIYHNDNPKSIFNDSACMNIILKNGEQIDLTTLIMDKESMFIKFRDQEVIIKQAFIPYIRKYKLNS